MSKLEQAVNRLAAARVALAAAENEVRDAELAVADEKVIEAGGDMKRRIADATRSIKEAEVAAKAEAVAMREGKGDPTALARALAEADAWRGVLKSAEGEREMDGLMQRQAAQAHIAEMEKRDEQMRLDAERANPTPRRRRY